MDKPIYQEVQKPNLENPILVQGLSGFGNVGKIACHLLIKYAGAKLFANLYSPTFPDYVTVNTDGTCQPPHIELYQSHTEKDNFIILTGDAQPSFDDVPAHYALATQIITLAQQLKTNFIITLGGIPQTEEKTAIYVAATNSRLAQEFAEKGATLYTKGRITGATGLTLALAKQNHIDGVTILAATTGFEADRGAGFNVFKYLMKTLGNEVKEGL